MSSKINKENKEEKIEIVCMQDMLEDE